MLFKSLALALATAATTALAADQVATEIADALTQYQAQNLIPDPIPADSYDLTSGLVLSFGGSNATVGKSFTLPADDATLKKTPVYQLDVPSNMASNYSSMKFTIALVDPGALGSTLGGTNVTRHYLANDLTYSDGKLVNSTAAIQDYTEPGPAAGSGAHRYLALVFNQGDDFKAPEGLNKPGTALSNMTLSEYIDESNIGKIVAMSYILVEDTSKGASTTSAAAVPSSTVDAYASQISSALASGQGATNSTSDKATSSSSSSGSSSSSSSSGSSSPAAAVAPQVLVAFAAACVAGAAAFAL